MNDCLWKLDGVTLDGDRRARLREISLIGQRHFEES